MGLNGQQLDLQPICPVLQDLIAVCADIPDPFRPLLKSVVDAVESVLVGNQSNFQSASSEIHEWVDKAPDHSARERSLFRFIADVFFSFLKCFFTKPLDLQPARSLLFDFVDNPSDEFVDLCKTPEAQLIKFVVDSSCTLVESFCNKKSDTDPMSTILNKLFTWNADLFESNLTIRKEIAYVIHIIIQHFFMETLGMIDGLYDLDLSLASSRMSKGVQEFLIKLYSTQVMHRKNLKKLRDLRHRLRLRGIRVYEHYLPVEK